MCNCWFSQDWKIGSNECGPWGNLGVGTMGHACNHPWHLGATVSVILLGFCSTYTSACLV